MDQIERRAFMKGAGLGALAFTVGGAEILLTPSEARAQGVPFRLLNANEGETIEALGETLVPFANLYRAAIGAVDRGSEKVTGRKFAALSTTDQRDFVNNMRQNKIEGWTGPSGGFVYTILRSDAVDVVYGTMEGYAALGIPYQAHIVPTKRW
jgi:hypothetical protein